MLGIDYTMNKWQRDCPADGSEGRLKKGESVWEFHVEAGELLAMMALGKL